MKWLLILTAWISSFFNTKILDPLVGYVVVQPTSVVEVVPVADVETENYVTEIPTMVPTIIPVVTSIRKVVPVAVGNTEPWGVAKQVGDHTWTMKVGQDPVMATPKEILDALNEYRVRRGSQRLTWDDNLAAYAQSRADFTDNLGDTDEHAGFVDYLSNQDGYNKLGFTWLGENISIGYRMTGVHLIEWIYAGDKPHDDNQVNNRWNYVGIGVRGTASALIFGTGRR